MSESVDLRQWIGRREMRVDWINPSRLAAWNATLDREDPFPEEGDPVPPGFHWALFPSQTRQSELGPDGHPKRGGFLPPVALPRRMWAGGRLRFHQPLRVGQRVEQVSTIDAVDEKHGRAGPLIFVTVRHAVIGSEGLAIEEEQDLVYRDLPKGEHPSAAAQPAPKGPWHRQIVPEATLLFRYSALTFNGHRIHYDRPFATDSEGYPGLVVHGPLIATLLLDLVRRHVTSATLERFVFKALRPTFDASPFSIYGAPDEHRDHARLWSTDNLGNMGMEAEAWMG